MCFASSKSDSLISLYILYYIRRTVVVCVVACHAKRIENTLPVVYICMAGFFIPEILYGTVRMHVSNTPYSTVSYNAHRLSTNDVTSPCCTQPAILAPPTNTTTRRHLRRVNSGEQYSSCLVAPYNMGMRTSSLV
jgi:hypothetical protein